MRMNEFSERIHDIIIQANIKARGSSIERRRRRDPRMPAAKWISPASIGGERGSALAVVLSTIGCSHARSELGGCTMCSYLLDGTQVAPTDEEILAQFDNALSALKNKTGRLAVKIYTSGSFLDTQEVSKNARDTILHRIAAIDEVEEVVIESRPEYVTDEVMSEVRELLGERRIEIGMGLESANDRVRLICINKGFTLDEFAEAVSVAKRHNIGTRAYVLLKPPFLTEKEALLDAVQTIVTAAELGATTVSVNPVNVQKNTLVEMLWTRGAYRPPWLWTLVSVLQQAREKVDSAVSIVCDPVAGGKRRGVHNCGTCDSQFVAAIREFSLTQSVDVFQGLECSCRETWYHDLQHETISFLVHK